MFVAKFVAKNAKLGNLRKTRKARTRIAGQPAKSPTGVIGLNLLVPGVVYIYDSSQNCRHAGSRIYTTVISEVAHANLLPSNG